MGAPISSILANARGPWLPAIPRAFDADQSPRRVVNARAVSRGTVNRVRQTYPTEQRKGFEYYDDWRELATSKSDKVNSMPDLGPIPYGAFFRYSQRGGTGFSSTQRGGGSNQSGSGNSRPLPAAPSKQERRLRQISAMRRTWGGMARSAPSRATSSANASHQHSHGRTTGEARDFEEGGRETEGRGGGCRGGGGRGGGRGGGGGGGGGGEGGGGKSVRLPPIGAEVASFHGGGRGDDAGLASSGPSERGAGGSVEAAEEERDAPPSREMATRARQALETLGIQRPPSSRAVTQGSHKSALSKMEGGKEEEDDDEDVDYDDDAAVEGGRGMFEEEKVLGGGGGEGVWDTRQGGRNLGTDSNATDQSSHVWQFVDLDTTSGDNGAADPGLDVDDAADVESNQAEADGVQVVGGAEAASETAHVGVRPRTDRSVNEDELDELLAWTEQIAGSIDG